MYFLLHYSKLILYRNDIIQNSSLMYIFYINYNVTK